MKLSAKLSALTCTVLGFTAFEAKAIDISPGDFTILPPGTNVALAYQQYSTADTLNLDGVGDIPGSKLTSYVTVLRFGHFGQIGDLPYLAQAFVPYGQFETADIGGVSSGTSDDFGDLTFGFTGFPVQPSNPETGTTLGIGIFVGFPTGNYDQNDISIGSGTYTVTPQIGIIKGLGNGLYFDGVADVAIESDHTDGGIDVSRDPAYQVQGFLRYQPSPTTSFSVGYSTKFGGELYKNGTYTGLKTRADTVKVFASHFLSPTVQIEGMLAKDIKVEGGFKNDATAQIRLLKAF